MFLLFRTAAAVAFLFQFKYQHLETSLDCTYITRSVFALEIYREKIHAMKCFNFIFFPTVALRVTVVVGRPKRVTKTKLLTVSISRTRNTIMIEKS